MTFSKKLKRLRKEQKISQEDIAESMGVSRQTVYRWENDLMLPKMEQLQALCKILNVPLEYLFSTPNDLEPTIATVSTDKEEEKALSTQKTACLHKWKIAGLVAVALFSFVTFMYFLFYDYINYLYYKLRGFTLIQIVSDVNIQWHLLIPAVIFFVVFVASVFALIKHIKKRNKEIKDEKN